ncbi:MAG TPA: N(4)-(beta-N-acetylglucosaminyl)-L-asparaginase [Gemmatimonadaceae bacterium]|nr:N(4)-(beta-N-acetylglucosaminyl)-L-asparaginase [Gemmatimonadaceae bacterium]
MSPTRRDFLGTGAAAAAAAAAGLALPDIADAIPAEIRGRAPARSPAWAGRPVVISSANGFRSRDASGRPAIQVAYDMMTRGADPLDSIVAGVQIVELDPTDNSVGLGGLPNEEGVVQLDASCMHGPTKRAGAVAALEDIATPAAVAKMVMDRTDHIMLVGAGAKKFALETGFKEQNLLTDESRQAWLQWKSRQNANDNWLDLPAGGVTPNIPNQNPPKPGGPSGAPLDDLLHVYRDADGVMHTYGTINMDAVNASGDICSVTTTSGLSWKVPGRTGDSPIVGAGQYCDNEVGAAGSTGRGEANIKVCGAFLAVEFMRQGMSPEQALIKVMQRVIAMTERRLLDDNGRPYFDLSYYAVNKKGEYAGASAYEGGRFAVCDANGPRLENMVYLFKGSAPMKTRPDAAYTR